MIQDPSESDPASLPVENRNSIEEIELGQGVVKKLTYDEEGRFEGNQVQPGYQLMISDDEDDEEMKDDTPMSSDSESEEEDSPMQEKIQDQQIQSLLENPESRKLIGQN